MYYLKQIADAKTMKMEHCMVKPMILKRTEVLDAGIITTKEMKYYNNCHYKVTGISLDQASVDEAKELGLNAKLASVLELDEKEKYHLVNCPFLMASLNDEDAVSALTRFKEAIVTKGGFVFASFLWSDHDYEENGLKFRTELTIGGIIKSAGLVDEEVHVHVQRIEGEKNLKWLNILAKKPSVIK